ncbi:MAG: ribulose phosphate epimerase [Spirochaetae bacterium HGW-Spirochaetae-1]|jgi:segregation and condensation protein A|nr:MAG: ribulose phosphate epimerase [Spirochaetae bacterium HGW-Spirochaetae-1]
MLEEREELQNNDADNKYVIHIDNFDGPLDILWDLIKKAKIDITEISISDITIQYIEYLKMMEKMNVRIASEFIWMASELLFYKSRALLPSENIEDEYFTPPLPPELINKLLEYKKFQQSSRFFRESFEFQADVYTRHNEPEDLEAGTEEYLDVSLFDLLRAFANVLESQSTVEQEEIIFDEILVSDRIEYITELLKENDFIVFIEIFQNRPSRPEVVATFLAILEMAKTKIIKIVQHRVFGEIRLVRNFSSKQIDAGEGD